MIEISSNQERQLSLKKLITAYLFHPIPYTEKYTDKLKNRPHAYAQGRFVF